MPSGVALPWRSRPEFMGCREGALSHPGLLQAPGGFVPQAWCCTRCTQDRRLTTLQGSPKSILLQRLVNQANFANNVLRTVVEGTTVQVHSFHKHSAISEDPAALSLWHFLPWSFRSLSFLAFRPTVFSPSFSPLLLRSKGTIFLLHQAEQTPPPLMLYSRHS